MATPRWPSLYNPGVEILNIPHSNPTQPDGYYLERPGDVFRFTFYWSLIFYTPIFLLCGAYAFWNYTFPPSIRVHGQNPTYNDPTAYQLVSMSPSAKSGLPNTSKLPRVNERRSRVAFAVIVLLVFLLSSLAGCVVGSAVMGYVTYGLYKAGGFHMSTWLPFILALLQVLIGMLSIWPVIIDII